MARTLEPERMESAPAEEANASLRDLYRINRWLGGYGALASVLDPYLRERPEARILDVGAADGATVRWLAKRYPRAKFVAFDRTEAWLRQGGGVRVLGDAFRWPVRPKSVDLVISSLFLHHFTNEEVVKLLANFAEAARVAVVAVDLHRHPLSRYFLPATQWIAGWHQLTVDDGVLSVNASFTPAELRALVPRARVRAHWPWFRLSMVLDVNRVPESR